MRGSEKLSAVTADNIGDGYMNKLKKPLIIAAAIIIVCGAVITTAALNMDRILMRVSPELYLSYIAVNTADELSKENAMIKKAMPDMPRLSESHMLVLNIDTGDHKISFTEDYNKETPSVVFNGEYDEIYFDGYINNTETALCLPSLLDVYFTFSTQNFGDEFNDGGGNDLLPVGIMRGMDLTLPTADNSKILSMNQLIEFARTASADAEIRHDSGDDYFLILKGDNVKTSLRNLTEALFASEVFINRFERVGKIFDIDTDSLKEQVISYIDSMAIGETLAVKYTQTKNYVSMIETDIPFPDSTLKLCADSQGARLLDDYTLSAVSESNGSKIGFEYSRRGNRMFEDEEKTDTINLKMITGTEPVLEFTSDISFDKNNSGFSGSFELTRRFIDVSVLSADISGKPVIDRDWASGVYTEITNIQDNGSSIPGTFSASLTPPGNLQPVERDKYPFKDLDLNDMSSLLELMQK